MNNIKYKFYIVCVLIYSCKLLHRFATLILFCLLYKYDLLVWKLFDYLSSYYLCVFVIHILFKI